MNVLKKSKEPITVDCYCLSCLKSIRKANRLNFNIVNDVLCNNCRNSLDYHPIIIKLPDFKVYGLYCYRSTVRDLLLLYKQNGDEALAYAFLYPYINRLRKRYRGYYVVEVPSSEKRIRQRGFRPVKKIFGVLNLPFLDVLSKKSDFQQKQSHKNRLDNEFELTDKEILRGKKILLVDDIITTSASVRACYNLLKGNCLEIKVVILCYNH
ncbi:MAG: ComF family protein [Erysipelotrichaceae bacterium]